CALCAMMIPGLVKRCLRRRPHYTADRPPQSSAYRAHHRSPGGAATTLMRHLAITAQQMHPSGIREIMDLAAQFPDSIHLEVGEPTFAPAPPILDAAKAAIDQGVARYTPNSGFLSLREKIAERLGTRGWKVSPSQIVVTPGAVCALFSAIRALVDPGDEVLVPDPGWPNYTSMAQLSGGQ